MLSSSYVGCIHECRIQPPSNSVYASGSQTGRCSCLTINSKHNPILKQLEAFRNQLRKYLPHIHRIICAEDKAFKKDTFNTLLWMDDQMNSQHTYLLMKHRTVEEAIKTNLTVPLDQLEHANVIFSLVSDQVAAGLYSNTEKLYQVVQKLGKQ